MRTGPISRRAKRQRRRVENERALATHLANSDSKHDELKTTMTGRRAATSDGKRRLHTRAAAAKNAPLATPATTTTTIVERPAASRVASSRRGGYFCVRSHTTRARACSHRRRLEPADVVAIKRRPPMRALRCFFVAAAAAIVECARLVEYIRRLSVAAATRRFALDRCCLGAMANAVCKLLDCARLVFLFCFWRRRRLQPA